MTKKSFLLFFCFLVFGSVYGSEKIPKFNPEKEFYDVFFGMLIEEKNVLYFKKCALVSPNMKIVDIHGKEDKAIRTLYEQSKNETNIIQLSTIANVKSIGKVNNEKYFINIKEITSVTHGKSCMPRDFFK